MIIGAVRGAGEPQLDSYLLRSEPGQQARLGTSRGLVARDLPGQLATMRARSLLGRSTAPIMHCWASPDPMGPAWTEADWRHWWRAYEEEFGLQEQPYTEVIHGKDGQEHRHRVYLLVRPDGTCFSLSRQSRRHEYLCRLAEHRTGARLIQGRHNRAVAGRLQREGRDDVADAMEAAGLLTAPLRSAYSTQERHQATRTGVPIDHVANIVLAAWLHAIRGDRDSDGFRAALAQRGLQVGPGTRATYVVWAATGGKRNLLGLLVRAASRAGLDPASVSLAAVRARLEGTAPVQGSVHSTEAQANGNDRHPIHGGARRSVIEPETASSPALGSALGGAGSAVDPGRDRRDRPAAPRRSLGPVGSSLGRGQGGGHRGAGAGVTEPAGARGERRRSDWRVDRVAGDVGHPGRGSGAPGQPSGQSRRARQQAEVARFGRMLAQAAVGERLRRLAETQVGGTCPVEDAEPSAQSTPSDLLRP